MPANASVTTPSVRSSWTPATVNGGEKKSFDAAPLAQELRNHADPEVDVRAASGSPLESRDHRAGDSPRRDSAPVDDGEEPLSIADERAELLRDAFDVSEVDRSVAAGRRTDRDQNGLRGPEREGQVGRDRQPSRGAAGRDELVEPWLDDRASACLDRLELVRVDVDPHHGVTELGETRGGHSAHVAQPDDDDLHPCPPTAKVVPTPLSMGR